MAPLSLAQILKHFQFYIWPSSTYVSADIENELSKLNSHWMKIAKLNVYRIYCFLYSSRFAEPYKKIWYSFNNVSAKFHLRKLEVWLHA